MSISGSMYSGISGLTVHSQAMSVIGDNLANTSTVGYKTATTQFQDLFYSATATAYGQGQVGHGATVSSIYRSFSEGSYESSSEVTDVAIGGDGFFIVTDPVTDETYYTRAGNFRFDEDGYLVNPSGLRVQGWRASENSDGTIGTVGSVTNIYLEDFQAPPQATSEITLYANLDESSEDNATDATDPFLAMFNQWDPSADEPLSDSYYAYQSTLTIYDEQGGSHDVTIYFDPVGDSSVASQAGGYTAWEFIVTCDPEDDLRTINGQELQTSSAAGLLMTGTLTMNAQGELVGMSAFTLSETATGDLKDASNWTNAQFDDEGYPVFTVNFSGAENASASTEEDAVNVALDLGLSNADTSGTGWTGTATTAADLGNDYSALPNFNTIDRNATATTSYDDASYTLTLNQDGFASGYLQDIEISTDGVLSGSYSNGQVIELYVFTLATFQNPQGLVLEGGSVYSEGADSGMPKTGRADTGEYGTVVSNSLEQSNVDLSTELVRMITTERGYQANSKVITTADEMLQTALQLKR